MDLRKQDRREPPAASQRTWIGGSNGIEKRQQMFARRILVPFTVTPDDFEQLVDRLFARALAVEHQCEIEPRLEISRIGSNTGIELFGVAGRCRAFFQ